MTEPNARAADLFETETMAELHARQGRLHEAAAIYARLLAGPGDDEARARWQARQRDLTAAGANPSVVDDGARLDDMLLPDAPGVRAQARLGVAWIAWSLPAGTASPAIEVLLIRRGAGGVETEQRQLRLDGVSGRLELLVAGLHAVTAAVGVMGAQGFVPMARTPRA